MTSRTTTQWVAAVLLIAATIGGTPTPAQACSPGFDGIVFGIEEWIGRDDIPRDWVLTTTRRDLLSDDYTSIWIRRLPDGAFEPLERWREDGAYYAAPATRPSEPGTYEVATSFSSVEDTTETDISDGLLGTFDVVDADAPAIEYPALLRVSSSPVVQADPFFFLHGCNPPYDGQTAVEFRYRRDPGVALYILRTDGGGFLQSQRPASGDEVAFRILEPDGGELNVELTAYDFAGRPVRTDAFGHAGCPGACSQGGNRASFVALFALLFSLRLRRRRAPKEKLRAG